MAPSQMPLFEDDYLRRTHGAVVGQPDVALTELVANCWDAGASLVEISLPEEGGGMLEISDDGVGMTADEFYTRWRTLSYNRVKHQGPYAEFPPGVQRKPRRAYGRNGVGRHAMFCFCDKYEVITQKDGKRSVWTVADSAGENPLRIDKVSESPSRAHGTILKGQVTRSSVRPDEMLEVLSARFVYDPEFILRVNRQTLELSNHSGLILHKGFAFADGNSGEIYVVTSGETARTKFQHGVAFWVGGRLVGDPSWVVGNRSLLDGRTKEAKRLTFIVKLDGLHDSVREDWSGFIPSPVTTSLFETTAAAVDEILRDLLSTRASERTDEIILARREQVSTLDPLGRMEVTAFARDITVAQPFAATEVVEAAVDALIRLENSRSGQALIQKLGSMDRDDIDGLNRLLDEWTVRDALTVLDEVGRRIRVVEAIDRLHKDKDVDELHTLHPLVAQARWLFGPEYDTPHYISNATLRTVLSRLVGRRVPAGLSESSRKRPDLLFLQDGTLSGTAVEGFNDSGMSCLDKILLLELKKGDSTIGRSEMHQAEEYVEEIMNSPEIDGAPRVQAFVVGRGVDRPRASERRIGERGTVAACTYDQLIRTANRRLFSLRDQVEVRYPEGADSDLVKALSAQTGLFDIGRSRTK